MHKMYKRLELNKLALESVDDATVATDIYDMGSLYGSLHHEHRKKIYMGRIRNWNGIYIGRAERVKPKMLLLLLKF